MRVKYLKFGYYCPVEKDTKIFLFGLETIENFSKNVISVNYNK